MILDGAAQPCDILIVEDDPSVADTVHGILDTEGYATLWAQTADAAIRYARAARPRLILMDYLMPGRLSGADVARKLHGSAETRVIPIILITAVDKPYERGVEVGADAVIKKPFHMLELLKMVDTYILPKEGDDGN